MTQYNLLNAANQRFGTTVNGHDFQFRLRTFRDVLYVDVTADGEITLGSVKALPNVGILSDELRRIADGDFGFICQYGDYPSYDLFNTSACVFVYRQKDE